MTPFQRLIGPLYADGINAPRISITGHDLPLSRVVSRTIHPDEGFHDHAGTVMVIAWGQFMDHDFTLTGNLCCSLNLLLNYFIDGSIISNSCYIETNYIVLVIGTPLDPRNRNVSIKFQIAIIKHKIDSVIINIMI